MLKQVCIHEAGHAAVAEILCPGHVNSIKIYNDTYGETELIPLDKTVKNQISLSLIILAGAASVELYMNKNQTTGR